MNRKIYFNSNYILLTQGEYQQTGNQVIIDSDSTGQEKLNSYLEEFIQQNETKPFIFLTKNVNSFFGKLKHFFRYIEAAGGLIQKEDKYLFIYRLEKWDLPKGKIDDGETPPQAAVRECMEECAISGLRIGSELESTYHIYEHKNKFVLKRTYWYLMSTNSSESLVPQTEENIEKAEWLTREQVSGMVLGNTYPSVKDLIDRYILS